MAYDSITQRKNKVNANLQKQFQDDAIAAQSSGQEGYKNYDDWYEANMKEPDQSTESTRAYSFHTHPGSK